MKNAGLGIYDLLVFDSERATEAHYAIYESVLNNHTETKKSKNIRMNSKTLHVVPD